MTNNITLTDSSGNVVTIGASNIKENWVNDMAQVAMPIAKANSSGGSNTLLVNLMRVKRQFTVTGVICYGGEVSDFTGTNTAQQQRTKLRNMVESNANVTLVYDDFSGSVGITKVDISEDSRDETTVTQYGVTIAMMKGTNVLG